MIDDMRGLYDCASAAYSAGKREGMELMLLGARIRMTAVAVKHEKAGNDEAFKAAEECHVALNEAVEFLRKRRKALNE
jgi:hypothetical protein